MFSCCQLKYCRYSIKLYPINQSVVLFFSAEKETKFRFRTCLSTSREMKQRLWYLVLAIQSDVNKVCCKRQYSQVSVQDHDQITTEYSGSSSCSFGTCASEVWHILTLKTLTCFLKKHIFFPSMVQMIYKLQCNLKSSQCQRNN